MINVLDKVQPKNKEQLKQLINYAFKHNIYNLNFIDISKITDMSELFGNVEHDFDVSSWDVSNAIDISFMFYGCHNFNCDLSKWDVSNVTNMRYMFSNCYKLEGKGLEHWDVSNVTDMAGMFVGCENFNCDLSYWYVSNVTDMDNMFVNCKKFNCDLSDWNISNITRWKNMFGGCDKMTIPNWYKLYHRK